MLFLIGCSALFGGVLFGYDLGVISAALLQLVPSLQLSCVQTELVVSALLMGAMLGAVIGGALLDQFGRRRVLLLNGVCVCASVLMLTFANSLLLLIVARLFLGICVSITASGECLYVSESAPSHHRGKLVSLNELGIAVGLLLAYLIGFVFVDVVNGWQIMFALAIVPVLFQFFCLLPLPESPRFLVQKGLLTEAEMTLQKLRGGKSAVGSVVNELNNIRMAVDNAANRRWTDLFSTVDGYRLRLLVGCGLTLFQQLSGQPNILFYIPTVLESVGFPGKHVATLATVAVGVIKLMATIVALLLVDRFGRRRMLLFGSVLMATSLLSIAAASSQIDLSNRRNPCHQWNNHTSPLLLQNSTSVVPLSTLFEVPVAGFISLIALMLFVFAYAMSYGPVTWLILAEIYPATLRARALSVAVFVNWSANLLVSLSFLSIIDALGIALTFGAHLLICVLSFFFVLFCVPETKDKSLEKISREFDKGLVFRKFRFTNLHRRSSRLHLLDDTYAVNFASTATVSSNQSRE